MRDFSILSGSLFSSNPVLHPNHTVHKANVPEMITEDYLSDVEEGIFHLNSFFFIFFWILCSKTSSVTLSACQSFVLSNLWFLFHFLINPVPVVSRFICTYLTESNTLLWELSKCSLFSSSLHCLTSFLVYAQTLVLCMCSTQYCTWVLSAAFPLQLSHAVL